jgi:hypothetical protein
LLFDPEDGGDTFFRNFQHGVIFQQMELFITNAVRTSKAASSVN